MTRRGLVATGILAIWVCGLGVLGYREMFPDEEKRRMGAALLIEPASYYYIVEQDGKHVGYASSVTPRHRWTRLFSASACGIRLSRSS
jgi:hypothetical protein